MGASADDQQPFANLLPLVAALIDAGNEMRDGGFVLNPDGWRCRLVRPIDFEVIRERFEPVRTIQLSPEHDTVLDMLTWCSIDGPGA
jgi:hypothetical protein